MYTSLVIIHVISMVVSLFLMSGAIGLGLFGKDVAAKVASVGMIATAFGAVTGSVLLFFAPALSECIILTSYLAAVTSLYIFGFGAGVADKARLIRNSAPIQKN